MEVRRSGRYISQAGDTNQYRFRRTQWTEDAMPLKQIAAHIDTLMARDAAKRFENLITGQLVRRHRVGFPGKPPVEAAVRRDQRLFVCRDRIQHRRDVRLPSVGVAKLPDDFGVSAQLSDGFVNARRHNRRIAKTALYSFFQRPEIALPIQAEVQTHIEDRRRIERDRLAFTRIVDIGAGTIGSYIVARRTTVCIIVRQTPVTKQSLSEQYTLRVLGARRGNWRNRLSASAGLRGRRLSVRRRDRVKANERQQQIRETADANGRRHHLRRH